MIALEFSLLTRVLSEDFNDRSDLSPPFYKDVAMNCFRLFTTVTLAGLLVSLICQIGCQPQQPFYLTEKGQYQKHLVNKATRIDYPDTEVPSTLEVCNSMPPLTLDNPNPAHFWDLTLEESIQVALKNSKIIRTLNGVSFSKAGVAGVAGSLLSSPSAISSVYDPALAESDPRYGVEAALSAFDAQLTAGINWAKSDNPSLYGLNDSQSDVGEFSMGLSKYTATGGTFAVNQYNRYYDGTDTLRSSWSSYLEGTFTQPLLQGNGIQFNRIAGPGATPGFYNGVAIARINTDTALNDFEMAARNLVADVEKAYWNLYYAYHYLESVKSGRDSAHQTWAQTYAMYTIGAAGGRAQYEAQSRNNYFTFRAQTEVAQSNLFKTENTLRYIMGLSSTDGRLIRPTDEPIVAPLRLDWHSVMCESLLRSPELRKQKWDVKKRELELIASKNFLLPRLDFSAGYRWSGAGEDWVNSRHHNNAIDSMTGGNYASWVMGLNASVPLGWRQELAGVRNAQLQLARSRAVLQEQELELTHQLADSFREISSAYQLSRTALQRRIAADAEVSSVNAAYKAGTTTLDQLLDAQKRQAEAETEYYRSIVDYNLAIMTLHYRKGSLLEYNNVCLTEGAWPGKAYFDAKRRARHRDAGHYMNYGYTRPKILSRGAYQQYQNHQGTETGYEIGSGSLLQQQPQAQPQNRQAVPDGEPLIAPPLPGSSKSATTIETTKTDLMSPMPSKPMVIPATSNASTASNSPTTSVSFTAPSIESKSVPSLTPVRNNRYLGGSQAPPL